MRSLKVLLLVALVLGVAGGIGWIWHRQSIYPTTSDAYIGANIQTVSPLVTGQISALPIVENQRVAEGDVLLQIDDTSLAAAVATAEANLEQAQQSAGARDAGVGQAEADLSSAAAALDDAQKEYDRNKSLFDLGDVSQAALDQATATRDEALSARDAAQSALDAARQTAGNTGADNAAVKAAQGELDQANFDLAHATISAPVDGWVANLSLRPGDIVAPGDALFSLVEDGAWWVDANFKETDLAHIRPGQAARLSIDMYPGTEITGVVESIGAGSGSVFSLLPAQNATGNWVKVTQRFPVRIKIAELPSDPAIQLRVGASVTAIVDTRSEHEAAE